jgi:hypothetical protein
LYWNQPACERLRQRIDREALPARTRRFFTPFVQRALAAAAVFLIAVGLIWWLPRGTGPGQPGPQLALVVHAGQRIFKLETQAPATEAHIPPLKDKAGTTASTLAEVRCAAQFQDELLKAKRKGKLPSPPAVALELALVNNSKRPTRIQMGEAAPTLKLEVKGPCVIRIPVADAKEPEFLQPQTLQLDPGAQHIFHIDRLIAGARGRLEYIYLTEPGEYMLTAELRLTADGQLVTVTAAPVRIRVEVSKNTPAHDPECLRDRGGNAERRFSRKRA